MASSDVSGCLLEPGSLPSSHRKDSEISYNQMLYRLLICQSILAILYTTRWAIQDSILRSKDIKSIKSIAYTNKENYIDKKIERKDNSFNNSSSNHGLKKCKSQLTIQLDAFEHKFIIQLSNNGPLISDKFVLLKQSTINDFDSREKSTHHYYDSVNEHSYSNHDHVRPYFCHYLGRVDGDETSEAALSILSDNSQIVDGYFHTKNFIYYLDGNISENNTVITRQYENSKHHKRIRDNFLIRAKRSIISEKNHSTFHIPSGKNSSSLFVEMVIVHDHSLYNNFVKNKIDITEKTLKIVNIMNAIYRDLNIFISLVGIVVWDKKDEINLTSDGDATLSDFLKYRLDKLVSVQQHDNAQLITSTSFNNSVVGKALKGTICTHDHSGGVNTHHSDSSAIVAATLAHELGHNLGMDHDEENENCFCPDDKCIMSPSSNGHPIHWSSCSKKAIIESRNHGLLQCLENVPQNMFESTCGNGFVEEGEDCDPGEALVPYGSAKKDIRKSCKNGSTKNCDIYYKLNPCCDAITCKFVKNATCANGPCCNLSTCSPYNLTDKKVCRDSKSECDFEEICDGFSEYCPQDVYYHNGLECGTNMISTSYLSNSYNYNRSRAFCFDGKCLSHEAQCRSLWGANANVAKNICFEQNVHGNSSGNCGYDRLTKKYYTCQPENTNCGMLHCVHNQDTDMRKTGKLNYGFESAATLTVSYFTSYKRPEIHCHAATIDAGHGIRDPGLVPNGAFCGENKMCVNEKCEPIESALSTSWCPSSCYGNGICDNTGVCHCYDGVVGTTCFRWFSLGYHISSFFYVILLLVPTTTLIFILVNYYKPKVKMWWYIHNRKAALKQKAKETATMQRKHINRENLQITNPIPLVVRGTSSEFPTPPV